MMSGSVLYTPFDLSDAVKVGRRRFWKQILPVTKINYKGKEVNFDPEFHMDLAQSFRDEAFDQVPVVFADGENRHNMDPRNFGGDVLDMQYRGPDPKTGGTWALIEADKDAAKAISKNPKLGVSARIRQALDKADGRSFKRAIEHVCLTMNPRVTGMQPWQAVDLSDEDADIEVVDLTAVNYKEGSDMATKTTAKKSTSTDGAIDLSALSDEEFQELLDLTTAEALERGIEDEDLDGEAAEERPRRTRRKRSKTKITVEKDSESDDDEDEEEDEDEEVDEAASADLTDSDKVIKQNEVSQFQQMRIDLAEDKWQTQRGEYLAAGVPAFLLDLAEPVLSLPDPLTIDLADDETLDASETIRKMLDGVKGVVDLTGELGHSLDLTADQDQKSEADEFLDAWGKQYG